jgi:hypothetical protein
MEWKKIVTGHKLAEGYVPPRGWGMSYWSITDDRYVLHPMPLNWLVAAGIWLIRKLRRPYFDRKEWGVIHSRMVEQWQQGYECGLKDAARKVIEDYEELRKSAAKPPLGKPPRIIQ